MKKTLKNMFFTLLISCIGSTAAAVIAWFFFGTAYGDPESLSVIVGNLFYVGIFLLCIFVSVIRTCQHRKNMV